MPAIAPRFDADEEAFEEHFDLTPAEFMLAVGRLDMRDIEQYERTREVNQEAAILWAIKVCKEKGILAED